MLENIKITSNNINNTNNNLNRPKVPDGTDHNIPFDILDPTRVNKPLKQEGSELNPKDNSMHNPNSIFEKILQSLDAAPTLSEGMKKILFSKQFVNSNIKSDPLLKAFFDQFVKDINMDKEKMLNFVKFQHNSYTKFSGEFFNFLRDAVRLNQNNDFINIVGNFLKSYDCYLSTPETTNTISNILKNITYYLPDILKDTFSSMTSKLLLDNPETGADINLHLLKSEIIPYLGKYISKTNDFGSVRDCISVLIHHIVRLETGLKDNFTNNVDNLFNYLRYAFNLSDKDISELKYSLINNFRQQGQIKDNSLDFMFKMIETGIHDNKNLTNRTTFEGITESLLANNNVHIPLIHIFMPVNYNGIFMFSELWINKQIDNNADKNNSGKKQNASNEIYKVFITFDIDKLGYFETTLFSRDDKLSLELLVPSGLKNNITNIKSDIANIIKRNGLNIADIYVNECIKQRKFYEVFDKKFIKERGINVIA